jgi:signal transduction histidine kinase
MAGRAPVGLSEGLTAAVGEVDRIIERIRSAIYQLGMGTENRGLRDVVTSLVRELDPQLGFDVEVSFDGPVESSVNDQLAEHLLATLRESVTNIGRHAQATSASVSLSVLDGQCRLTVIDNGDGFDGSTVRPDSLGLINLRRRAEKLGGTFEIGRADGGGTSLIWQVPLFS